MQKIRFLYNNLFDAATWAPSFTPLANSEFPGANLMHPWPTRHWRSSAGVHSDVTITWNFGSALTTNVFSLKYHNITSGSTITLMGDADDSSWADPTYTQPLTWAADKISFFTGTKNLQYWRLRVQDPGSPVDNCVKIGRIFHGTYFEPTVNFSNVFTKRITDASFKQYSTGGQLSVMRRSLAKTLKYTWGDNNPLSHADMDSLSAIYENYIGLHTPYFLCQDADDLSTMYYVENTEEWEFSAIFMDMYYRFDLVVKEVM